MIAYCAHYRDGKRVAADLAVDRAAELARARQGFVWIALRDPSPDELAEVARAFGLPVTGLNAAGGAHARPRLEGEKGRYLLVMRSARWDAETQKVDLGQIRVVIGAGYVISVGRGGPSDPEGARQRLEELHPDLIAMGEGAVVWVIIDQILDGYEPVAESIDNAIEQLERQVFSGGATATEETYRLTRETIEFHRAVASLLNPLDAVVEGELVKLPDKLEQLFRDAAAHLKRIEEELSAQRELLSGILGANLALISVRQSDVVQKISAWAAIVAVPTFLASIWGMNFTHMPELHLELGYPLALGAMLAVTILLYRFFKRIQWL
jgi:magnesium transporter